jgi:hypothetical protein
VEFDGLSEFPKLRNQFTGGREQLAHPDERSDNIDVHATAISERSTLESIATPCSVNARGGLRRPP